MPVRGGAAPGRSLNDLLRGGLGGLLGGAAAGTVLSGGLDNLIKELEERGYGKTAQSWVGTGPNHEIAPKDLANALGSDTLDEIGRESREVFLRAGGEKLHNGRCLNDHPKWIEAMATMIREEANGWL